MPKGEVGNRWAITKMQRGGYRGECLITGCGFWADSETPAAATLLLRSHMKNTHQVFGVYKKVDA